MNVRFGALSNVYGKPAQRDGYSFMPANVELDGSSFSLDYRLSDQFGDLLPPALRSPISEGIDAAWVRARIPNIFGFTPDPAEIEKSLLYSGFVAVTEDRSVCYPFLCTDHYGRAALMFSNDGPEEAGHCRCILGSLGPGPRRPDGFRGASLPPGCDDVAKLWLPGRSGVLRRVGRIVRRLGLDPAFPCPETLGPDPAYRLQKRWVQTQPTDWSYPISIFGLRSWSNALVEYDQWHPEAVKKSGKLFPT